MPVSDEGYQHIEHGFEPVFDERSRVLVLGSFPSVLSRANAFYYEKLVYLASMILRRDDAAAYRVQINELGVGIRAGLQDPNLGRNPRLPLSIRAAAWATINCPVLWRKVCRTMLKDRR